MSHVAVSEMGLGRGRPFNEGDKGRETFRAQTEGHDDAMLLLMTSGDGGGNAAERECRGAFGLEGKWSAAAGRARAP